jgi:hypothetical protein
LADCAAQGVQERPLPDGIAVSVLGQQPCRPGALLTDQRPPRPVASAENFREPPRVLLIDALPLRCDLSSSSTRQFHRAALYSGRPEA